MNRPIVFGHRGASGYEIENTIPSFQLSVKMNADAVELDAQLTSDGEVIVFHDFSLNRLFNVNKRISELSSIFIVILLPMALKISSRDGMCTSRSTSKTY